MSFEEILKSEFGEEKDLLIIKRKATENGLPYQSLINVLIHQYAEGKIVLNM